MPPENEGLWACLNRRWNEAGERVDKNGPPGCCTFVIVIFCLCFFAAIWQGVLGLLLIGLAVYLTLWLANGVRNIAGHYPREVKAVGVISLVVFGVIAIPIATVWIMKALNSHSKEYSRKGATSVPATPVPEDAEERTTPQPTNSQEQSKETPPPQPADSLREENKSVLGFNSDANGYTWNAASESDKRNLCNGLASATLNRVSADSFYDALNETYNTTDPHILEVSLRFTCQYIGRSEP